MIAGVFSFDKTWSPNVLAERLATATCRYRTLNRRMIVDGNGFTCFVIEPQNNSNKVINIPLNKCEDLILVGEVALAEKRHQQLRSEISDQGFQAIFKIDGTWVAIIYDTEQNRLRLAVDPLGVKWIYLARFKQGCMFCSDYGALATNYPGSLTLDNETILVSLGLGYTPNDETVFKEITLLAPGVVLELARESISVVYRRPVEYGDRYATLSTHQKYELLDDIYERTIDNWLGSDPSQYVISFSGGYDSLYGLALLRKRDISARCLTFGQGLNPEVKSAMATCKRLNIQSSVYSIEKTSWESWKGCVEQVGALGGFHQWQGWAEEWLGLLRSKGSKVMIGYLGDALSGKHLVHFTGNWLQDWERWSSDGGWMSSSLLRPEARRLMQLSVRDRLEDAAAQATYVFPHQRAMHLDWYGRQRKFVAAQPNMIARVLSPVTYFYTNYGMDFWSNLPMSDLQDQLLYLSYARSRFADLFKPECPPSMYRRIIGASSNLLKDIFPTMKEFVSPPIVDRKKMIIENRSHIVSFIKGVDSMLDPVIDVKSIEAQIQLFPKTSLLTTGQLLYLVNLSVLLRSAGRSN
jgi:hypothetical protein